MANTAQGSLRLFQLFGIDVFVHWTWFVAAFVLFQLTGDGQPAVFVAVYLSLFGIVLMHEFGHALACRSVGGEARNIVLWPLGGIAFVNPPQRPGPVLWSIVAGPLVNVLLLPVTIVLALLVGVFDAQQWTPMQQYVASIAGINLGLLVFNLLPIYPLDGGQILQSILWFFLGRTRSLFIAAGIGIAAAILGGIAAAMVRDWWLVVIAVFLASQSYNGLKQARYLTNMGQWRV